MYAMYACMEGCVSVCLPACCLPLACMCVGILVPYLFAPTILIIRSLGHLAFAFFLLECEHTNINTAVSVA